MIQGIQDKESRFKETILRFKETQDYDRKCNLMLWCKETQEMESVP